MSDNFKIQVIRPFGPSIAKVQIPEELIKKLNDYVDETIKDEKKSKEQDQGKKLVGNVTQEFKLDNKFLDSSGFLKFLGVSVQNWIKASGSSSITKFDILDSWIVRQFKNEFNPIHWHSGHVSGVGYLKVPKTWGENIQETKRINKNGRLELIHGTRMFLSQSTFCVEPRVGDFYFFPNYMMHAVYPFLESSDERRSVSFNANIDDKVYNVYKGYL